MQGYKYVCMSCASSLHVQGMTRAWGYTDVLIGCADGVHAVHTACEEGCNATNTLLLANPRRSKSLPSQKKVY